LRSWPLHLSAAAAGVVVLALAAPTLASSSRGRPEGGHLLDVASASSPTFAGYAVQGGGEASFSVSARIRVPKLKCSRGPERAVDPSVGVYNAKKFSSAGVFVGCYKRKAYAFLSFVVDGQDHNYKKLAARAGDTVALRVSQSSASTKLSAVDMARKRVKKSLKGTGSKTASRPWVGDSGWDNPGLVGVPNFGKLHYSGALLDGEPFGSSSAVIRVNRVKGKTVEIRTGAFAANQKSFSTHFKHS
jgi:Peptidase A4 family